MPKSPPAAIAQLATQASTLRDQLMAWAEVNSGSDHLAGLLRMAGLLRAACAELTPDTTLVPVASDGRVAVRARRRPEAPIQILCSGHYDTVYGAAHPFQRCTLRDAATLNGPGVADMKGGLVLLLAALHAFEHTPQATQLGWEILLTPDEEIGSAASRALLEEAASRHHLALIFEPARENGDIVQSRKGTGIFTVTVHGRAAHAGRDPRLGRNAIVALAELLPSIHRLPEELPGVLLNIGSVRGGGAVNIVPDLASAELNARITRADDADTFLARLHALTAPLNAREGYRVEITGQFNRPPMESGPVSTALFAAWQDCARELGLAPFSWVHVGGGSDGNLLAAAGLPCLDGLGPVGGELHSEREWVHLPSIAGRAQLAALFLHRLALGEITLPVPGTGGKSETRSPKSETI
ncbi:MAG TPA: hydrolase [Opitutaceae bacterium]